MITTLQQQFPTLSLRRLCRLVGVSRSWYYAHPTPETLAERDLDLRDAIERVTPDFPGHGYCRVTHALQREGWAVNHKRVLRVMRQESLLCHLKRQFLVTTNSAHGLPTYPNLLAETPLSAPN
jgi:putative transposase